MTTLSIVLLNAERLDVDTAGRVSCVDKESRRIVLERYDQGRITFEKRSYDDAVCIKCGARRKPVRAFGRCGDCLKEMPLTTATESKKTYGLTDDDLERLNVHEYYVRSYRLFARLFDPHELMTYALVKHGGPTKKNERRKPKPNKALEKREKQIERMELDFDDRGAKWDLCVAPFLQNGAGGLREVRARIRRFDEFERELGELTPDERLALTAHAHRLRSAYTVRGGPTTAKAMIRAKVDDETRRAERRQDLEAALEEVGLELRADSKVCRAYVDGSDEYRRSEVVEIMQEMDFLHRHTDYARILTSLIREWREETRDDHGWLEREEYDDMFESALGTLSAEAKRRAMRGRRRDEAPRFMWKWMS